MRDAGLETSSDGNPVVVARVEMASVGEELVEIADGNPELRIEDEIETAEKGRSDADDGEGAAGKGDGLAEDVGIGVEASFPDTIAENDDRGILFVGEEAAAEGHGGLGDVEEIGGGGLTPEALGIAITGDGGGEEFVEAGDAGEGLRVIAEIVEKRPGERVAAFVVFRGVEGEERGGIAS